MPKLKEAIDTAVDAAVEKALETAQGNLEAQIEEKLKELSKDAISARSNETPENKELVAKYYKALASKDPAKLKELETEIIEDYKAKGQNISADPDGGYLVPETIASSINDKLEYVSPLRRVFNVISNMPAKLTLHSGSLPTTYWVDEEAPITESKVQFSPKTLVPHKAAGLDTISSEFLEDATISPSIQNYIEDRFVLALALLENAAFTNGDGVGKPFGFRSSDITPVAVAATAAGFTWQDAVKLKWSLGAAYVNRGTFLTSPEGFQIIESLKDGNGRPLYRESTVAGTPSTFLGRPIEVIDEIPGNLGAGADETELWYVSGKEGYTIGDRGDLRIDYGTSGDDFARDRVKLRVIKRVAGRPHGDYNFAKMTAVKAAA